MADSRRPLRRAELTAERLERRRIVVVAVDIFHEADELVERRGVEAAVLLEAVLHAGAELLVVPARLGDADDRNVEMGALQHRLQRREDLLVGQVPGGSEEDQGVGARGVHRYLPSFFSR
jgi:hypothetical protein